jgi:hypothetical protein
VAQTMYTHVSRCKNDKIKERKKKKINLHRYYLGTKQIELSFPIPRKSYLF